MDDQKMKMLIREIQEAVQAVKQSLGGTVKKGLLA
jgi:hypothetical protein